MSNRRFFQLKKKLRNALPRPLLEVYFWMYPAIGNLIYGRPSSKLRVIGITGTDGKSSTVILTARLLQAAGYKVGFFSSIAYHDGLTERPNTFKMTMPGRLFLQRFLHTLVGNGCDIAILEVTSEGIKQKRHSFIRFDTVVCTNVTPEHIEAHGGFEAYLKAKQELFRHRPKTIIVNADDANAAGLTALPAERHVTYGFNTQADVHGKILTQDLFQTTFEVSMGRKTPTTITLNLGGPFIAYNALAAITVAQSFGVDLASMTSILASIPTIPGRFEIVSHSPLVIVDYAHTVAALERLLPFLRAQWPHEIIHIFGAAGGGRDAWKRPVLAHLSEEWTDRHILTEENSFDEPTKHILDAIRAGFESTENVQVIPKRRNAVKRALKLAQSDSMILFTGKGCETAIAGPHGTREPYSEVETVTCLLKNISSEESPASSR